MMMCQRMGQPPTATTDLGSPIVSTRKRGRVQQPRSQSAPFVPFACDRDTCRVESLGHVGTSAKSEPRAP